MELSLSEDLHHIRALDIRGTQWEFQYDAQGRLSQLVINGEPYLTYTRDAAGRPLLVDYGKFRERYAYDERGRLRQYTVEALYPASTTRQIDLAYDAQGQLTGITGAGLGAIRVARNGEDVVTVQVEGRTLRTQRDAVGRIRELQGPEEQGILYQYGDDHRIRRIALRSGGQHGEFLFRQGKLEELADLSGARTRYEYSPEGHLLGVIDPYGTQIRYAYDSKGRLARVVTPAGLQTVYSYDSMGRLLQIREE
jgi:YD repeat-containing protein